MNEQIIRMVAFVQRLPSGGFAPLWSFPEWFQTASLALPFQAVVNTPLGNYVGRSSGSDAALLLALQGFWCLALGGVAAVVWRRAAGRVDAFGG